MSVFRCQACQSDQFQLMVQPQQQASVTVEVNEVDEVVITVNGKPFIADLMFMNQFAVCKGCGSIRQWDYYFPQVQASLQKEADLD